MSCTLQVLAEVVQTGPHAALELQYTRHDGSAASIPLEFATAETSKGDALAVLHAMWCALHPDPHHNPNQNPKPNLNPDP